MHAAILIKKKWKLSQDEATMTRLRPIFIFIFVQKRAYGPKERERKKLNYTQIPRHASPGNIIINESLKFTGWRLQNNQIPRIQ